MSPEDIVFIYKNLVREQEDSPQDAAGQVSQQQRASGLLDYQAFKKAVVRVSVRAQEQLKIELGGGDQKDLLKKKLETEAKQADGQRGQRAQLTKQRTLKDKEKQDKLDHLKQQFAQEQQYKADQLSKANPEKREKDASNATLTSKTR